MKIVSSSIELSSQYTSQVTKSRKESLRQWDNRGSASTQQRMASFHDAQNGAMKKIEFSGEDREIIPDAKLRAIVMTLEALSGKKIDLRSLRLKGEMLQRNPTAQGETEERTPQLQGWGLDYLLEKQTAVMQRLDISAQGSVTLDDGSSFELMLGFSLSQSVVQHERMSIKAGDALIDPLAISFDGGVVTLGDVRHRFDLNLDGKVDEISFVDANSGFLALDGNGDGIINDGSELFGPESGNGFAELARYDEDGNGWIDEADSIFDKLLIWTKTEEGTALYHLKEKGVGAIYLGAIDTFFDYYRNGDIEGKLRQSSLFLNDNGGGGMIGEVDIKI